MSILFKLFVIIFIIVKISVLYPVICSDIPVIQPFSFPDNIIAGKSISIFCTVTDGIKPITFSWLKNNVVLTSDGDIKINNHDLYSALIIDHVDVRHKGNYTCKVKNKIGSDSHTAFFDIKVPPRWITEPMDQSIIFGSNHYLDCKVFGFPSPQVKWLKLDDSSENTPILAAESDRWTVLKNGTIIITNVKKEDSGTYMCQADNKFGNTLKKIIKIDVFGKIINERIINGVCVWLFNSARDILTTSHIVNNKYKLNYDLDIYIVFF
ncbi:cell adhesion molecule DSCAM-like [Centruroides vittatus]|uniref:cell adhesion molecule DSCAM-like n=1 Tax=Centruroides vittatus TaxID=120091 RepID=UPI00350FEE61